MRPNESNPDVRPTYGNVKITRFKLVSGRIRFGLPFYAFGIGTSINRAQCPQATWPWSEIHSIHFF